ncbi:MAG: hypothetical protein KAQ67_04200, partial [Gammaproteobacteria bacterium]|nr:hypothetical protein [Gammaproteobacteria bacterium]
DNFKIETHYQLTSIYSNSHDLNYNDPDKFRLFSLSKLLTDDSEQLVYHRLDRLFITYSTDNTTTKFGRQAITWGNGLVYNVMDIFNPFSPTAIDKEYKVGDDMLYTQILNNDGNDWQILYLPRLNNDSDIDQSESSLAAKYHFTLFAVDVDILFAKHYENQIIGAGFNYAIGDALWRFDITVTETEDKQQTTSLVSNIDYSWTSFNKNIYGFIEFYHNGFGNENFIDPANTNLNERISRGEIFTPFKNYLASGISIELHPLVTLSPTLIHEIDNNNSSLIVSLNYDWKQNLSLKSSIIYNQSNDITPSENSVDLLLSYYF